MRQRQKEKYWEGDRKRLIDRVREGDEREKDLDSQGRPNNKKEKSSSKSIFVELTFWYFCSDPSFEQKKTLFLKRKWEMIFISLNFSIKTQVLGHTRLYIYIYTKPLRKKRMGHKVEIKRFSTPGPVAIRRLFIFIYIYIYIYREREREVLSSHHSETRIEMYRFNMIYSHSCQYVLLSTQSQTAIRHSPESSHIISVTFSTTCNYFIERKTCMVFSFVKLSPVKSATICRDVVFFFFFEKKPSVEHIHVSNDMNRHSNNYPDLTHFPKPKWQES